MDSKGELQLKFSPAIPGWLFNGDGIASFTFLGSVTVTYVNPKRFDTWKVSPSSATVTGMDGNTELDTDGILGAVHATRVRNLEIKEITVYYD